MRSQSNAWGVRRRYAALLATLWTSACSRNGGASRAVDPSARPSCACANRAHGVDDAASNPASARTSSAPSVFTLEPYFTTNRGEPFSWSLVQGHPTLVVFFYGTCRAACPVLLRDAQRIEAALSARARAQLRVLLVTFDPSVDTLDRLRELARERNFDLDRWTLLRGQDEDIRALSSLLDVRYTRVAPGEYAHDNVLTLLDARGVVVHRQEGLAVAPDAMVQAIEAMTR